MSNEFEKLDLFMRQHAPALKAPASLPRPRRALKGLLLASLLAVVIVARLESRQSRASDENTLALSEVLEWDVTSDEMPAEVEDLIAWAE